MAILLADYFGFLKPFKSFFESKLVIPVRISLKPVIETQTCPESQAEILSLKTQIASLKEEIISTRRLLGAPLPSDWRFLPVKVIGGSEDEIIIDKGEVDGIKKDFAAISAGIYLGKVEKVSPKISKIRLPAGQDSKEVAKIVNKESLSLVGKGLLLGKGGGKMELREILAEEEVDQDDLVVVTVEGFDLPVGKISSVNYKKGDVFKTALVEQEIKARNLQTIFLITGKI